MSKGRSYSVITEKALFSLSGGSCTICGESLVIENENSKGYRVIGEIAHIIGLNPGSKRYKKQPTEVANDQSNLMLVCPSCHKKIDSNSQWYTVKKLRELKVNHESQTINQIDKIINKTKIGGFTLSKNSKLLYEYAYNESNDHKYAEECCEGVKKDLQKLCNLSITPRVALLDMLKSKINEEDKIKDTRAYLEDAYGNNIDAVLDPLITSDIIDIDDWNLTELEDRAVRLLGNWDLIVEFCKVNNIALEQVIIERDFSVLDK